MSLLRNFTHGHQVSYFLCHLLLLFSVVENFLVLEKAQSRVVYLIGMNFDIKYYINDTNSFTFSLDFFRLLPLLEIQQPEV